MTAHRAPGPEGLQNVPENLLTEWARLLVESLAAAGVRSVVVSPGSRSTPLVWAALSSSRLSCTRVVDERDAAFFALGQAKMTGLPSAVLCTSGSAAANYFPAVVEAALSRTPLVVVTADRPFELMDCAAPQTLDQNRLYGEYVRAFVDVGMPEADPAVLAGLRRRVMQAVFESRAGEPGPVHLNVRMRKPLEPATPATDAARALAARVDALISTPATDAPLPLRVPPDDALRELAARCLSSRAGVVVCGPSGAAPAARSALLERYARATGSAVYAEVTSQLRFAGAESAGSLDGLDVLLRSPSFQRAFRPDLVIQLGAPPTSGAWERFVAANPEIPRYVLTPHGWPDPHGTARAVITGDLENTLERLTGAITAARASEPTSAKGAVPPRFPPWWSRANDAAWSAVEAALRDAGPISEGAATRAAARSLPPGGVLAVGNSLPVRHADVFCRASDATAVAWSQRGVSGIDGVVAGAAGAAAASQRPTVLVVGDVSALHDLGGFSVASGVKTPLVIVILNNDGGRIFEQLPLAGVAVPEERFAYWTTPHGGGFAGLAQLFRVTYARAESLPVLESVLASGLSREGCTVVEVPVPPHGAKDVYRALAEHVEAAVLSIVESSG